MNSMTRFAKMEEAYFKKYTDQLLKGMVVLHSIGVLELLSFNKKELKEFAKIREEMIEYLTVLMAIHTFQKDPETSLDKVTEEVLDRLYNCFNDRYKRWCDAVEFFKKLRNDRLERLESKVFDKREEILNNMSDEDRDLVDTLGSMCEFVLHVDEPKDDKIELAMLYNKNGPTGPVPN
jgi:Asp-tRNA(Asn)/Glu-tRNA(Gln) amidotransferase C subunit